MASPLTLQPDDTTGVDRYIIKADNSGWNDEYLQVQTTSSDARRSLITFDLSDIPEGATITDATLTLTSHANRYTSDTMNVHRLTRSWTETGANWNTYDGSNNWTTAGGDYDGTADASFTPPATAGSTVDIDITALVQEWVDGTTNYGLIIKVGTELTDPLKGCPFRSSGYGTAGDRPKLVVTYVAPSASPSVSPSVSSSVSSSISPSASGSASASKSASKSLSPSASPSTGYTGYTRGNYADLPANDTDLENAYSAQDVLDVAEDDATRVGQVATQEYMIHQFKNFVGSDNNCVLSWNGQSSLAPLSSAVVLQIYNRNTPEWENVDSNNSANANTDFTLSGSVADLTNYKDASNVISCRVYQLAT